MKAEVHIKRKEWISVIGKNKLQLLQDSFATLFNISLGIVTPEGEAITVWSNSSLKCEEIKYKNAESCKRERQSILKYVREKQKTTKYTCYMGITNFACPVVYQGELVAVCLGGGIVEDKDNDNDVSILRDVPYKTEDKLDEIIGLLDCIANLLSSTDNPDESENSINKEERACDLLLIKNKLTMRELEVVRLINCGLSNKEISLKLNISEKTVKTHMSNILRKLKLKDRLEVILYCKNSVN